MAHTIEILIPGEDFFVARLDTGGVRVGLKRAKCADFPADSVLGAAALVISSEAEAEEFFYAHVAGL